MHKLDANKLDEFLQALSRGRTVFALESAPAGRTLCPAVPAPPGAPAPAAPAREDYHLVRADAWQPGKHTLGAFRAVEPLKTLVFPPREFLGPLSGGGPAAELPERIVLGVKNCDLSALKIHDHVFLGTEPADPVYAEARRKTILVACDCTAACPVCFCPAVKEQPYAKEGFDLNLSPTPLGIVVEAGSDRGRELLKQAEGLLVPADPAILAARDAARRALTETVCAQAEAAGLACGADLRKAVEGSRGKPLWNDFAKDCVECGACNLVCCTCHCFLLADGRDAKGGCARVKLWDACLYRNFATVAGGANPRRHRAERLFNRFEKKFSFFPEILGRYACDGCGRCVEACTGKIDIREVLKRAIHER